MTRWYMNARHVAVTLTRCMMQPRRWRPPCWRMCSTKRCTNPCPTPTDGSRGQNGSRCKSQIPPGSRWAWLSEQWQFNLSLIPTIIGHTSKSLCIPALELATTCTSLSSCPSCPHQEHRIPSPWLSKFSALICFFKIWATPYCYQRAHCEAKPQVRRIAELIFGLGMVDH